MQYRVDIRTGNKISVLGFGCMRFSLGYAKTEELVLHAVENGVNYFDTAWIYPGSEETLGKIFSKNNIRDKVYITTKLPLFFLKGEKSSAADFDKYFNHSLSRLKTDYVDYYLMHMITDFDQWQKLKNAGIEDWIAQKKKSGQIRQIGFSFHGSGTDFLKILNDYDWETCLIQYNYFDENYQAGITGLRAAAPKMPVIIMEPLLGGKLVNNLPKEAVKIFKQANADLSPAGWAFNWLWNQSEPVSLLSGMSNMQQLNENLVLADIARENMHGDNEKAVYKAALNSIKRACKIICTGCNYCMPCPYDVNISGSFSAYNSLYSMGYIEGMKQYIQSTGFMSVKNCSPSLCVNCGKCEKHCPQNISIMKELSKVRKKMEPWFIKFIGVCVRAILGTGRKQKKANA